MTFQIRQADQRDVASWSGLVAEVEELFGPMPAFEAHLHKNIDRGTALVVGEHDMVQGAALLSREGRPQCIHWLAVRSSCRRRGVGGALLGFILDRWPAGDVEVTLPVDADSSLVASSRPRPAAPLGERRPVPV